MLNTFDKIAKGYKTYTSTALFAALAFYLNQRGVDVSQAQSLVEQVYHVVGDGINQIIALLAGLQIIIRKAMADKQEGK